MLLIDFGSPLSCRDDNLRSLVAWCRRQRGQICIQLFLPHTFCTVPHYPYFRTTQLKGQQGFIGNGN